MGRRWQPRSSRAEDRITESIAARPASKNRDLVLELYDAAIAAASPGAVTQHAVDSLSINREARVSIYAFGKAATPMAAATVMSLSRSMHAIVGGIVVSPDRAPSPYPTLVSMPGDHPVPGRDSFAAAAKIADISSGRMGNDVAMVLISGGTSSMIGAPLRGMNEADLIALFELLLGSGLDIAAMNAVRKRFSRWGAGRLALALAPAATHCLAISDVANDDLGVIGSGPCVPDTTTTKEVLTVLEQSGLLPRIPQAHRDYLTAAGRGTIPDTPTKSHPAFAHVTARVVGNTQLAVKGAATLARERGLAPEVVAARLTGDSALAGESIARQLLVARASGAANTCIVWGGETTVTLAPGTGRGGTSGGGRCQELALAASRVLHGAGADAVGISILAAGTDGRDGATDAAGAVVDSSTWSTIASGGRDPAEALASHQSNGALRLASALIGRRETGTNVNDVVIGLV